MYLTPFVAQLVMNALEYATEFSDPEEVEWRRLMLRFEDLVSSDTADDMWVTLDFCNITNETVDTSWTDADYAMVEGEIAQFLTTPYSAIMCNNTRFAEFRWYRRMYNPIAEGVLPKDAKHFVDSGPPVRVVPFSIPGQAGAYQAPQVAWTITEITSIRANWGRLYLPKPAPTYVGSSGQIAPATVQSVLEAWRLRMHNCMTAELFPVVPLTQVDGITTHGLLTVDQVRMDSVQDVQRRRRPVSATTRITASTDTVQALPAE